jgi:Cellulase (glycosyl hydrolase family 5)
MKRIAILLFCLFVANTLLAQNGNVLRLDSKNPHYFLYKGKATVLVGSGEHYGSVINTAFDYKIYLQAMAKDKLNLTRLFTGAYIEKPGDFGIKRNTLAPDEAHLQLPWKRSNIPGFNLGGNKFDLTLWDETYFARLKQFMAEAEKNGVIVEVNLFSAYYQTGWQYSALNSNNNINHTDSIKSSLVNSLKNGNILPYQEKYVRKIVKELNSFSNFYFEVQNEPYATLKDTVILHNEYGDSKDFRNSLEIVAQSSNNWQRKVSGWIKDEESHLPVKHLISQNISNFQYPVTNPDPNISIFNFHYALPKAVTENFYLNKVIGFNETGFAGRSDLTYRRQAWRFLMAGGGLFNQLDYSFSVGFENGSDSSYTAPGGGSPALRRRFGVLKRLFDQLNLATMHPDQSAITASPGAMTEVLSNGKTKWVVYVEHLAMKTYPLTLKLPKGVYKGEWTDVINGKVIEKVLVENNVVLVPGNLDDKVLVIDRVK